MDKEVEEQGGKTSALGVSIPICQRGRGEQRMGPNYMFTALFSPREGATVASTGEPEEHGALGGHLHPPDLHLCLLDHVSLRFLYGQHRVPWASWSLPSRPFKPQDSQGTGAFLLNPDTGAGLQPLLPPGPALGPESPGLCVGSSLSPRERQ